MPALYVFFLLLVITPSMVHANDNMPIRYKVDGNNRIFMGGENERYIDDLNKYLRCVAFKQGQPTDTTPACVAYRKQGTLGDRLVPNLRSGATRNEYRIQYDKVHNAYPKHYALNGRRKVVLFLDDKWTGAQASAPSGCRWIVSTAVERKYLDSKDCAPAEHEIDLTLSEPGTELSWTATAQLNVELSSGARLQFDTSVFVRDFLIVAIGDSFTSGEGNPERNRTDTAPAQWMDYRCHRSLFSYPAMVATTLALADPRHSVTLVHVACSGAQITEGILEKYTGVITRKQAVALWRGRWPVGRRRIDVPHHWKRYGTGSEQLESQLTQVQNLLADGNRTRRPDLLLMSIGVNDVGLVRLLKKLALTNCQQECLYELQRWRTSGASDCDDRREPLKRSFSCLEQSLRIVRTAIEQKIAPQQTYLVEYPNPLRDDKDRLCMSQPQHGELLKGVLGSFGGWISPVWSLKLSLAEIQYAEAEFYIPLKQAHLRIDSVPNWITIEYQGVENMRGFCARPSWYHTYQESKLRQYLNPNTLVDSVGTLHPNTKGHEHVMVRVLSRLRRDRLLIGHNLSLLDPYDFSPEQPRTDGYEGLAWILGSLHKEDVTRYYRF